jgi:hypothetical protein
MPDNAQPSSSAGDSSGIAITMGVPQLNGEIWYAYCAMCGAKYKSLPRPGVNDSPIFDVDRVVLTLPARTRASLVSN